MRQRRNPKRRIRYHRSAPTSFLPVVWLLTSLLSRRLNKLKHIHLVQRLPARPMHPPLLQTEPLPVTEKVLMHCKPQTLATPRELSRRRTNVHKDVNFRSAVDDNQRTRTSIFEICHLDRPAS